MNVIFDAEYRLLHNKKSEIYSASATQENMREPLIIAIGRALCKGNAKFCLDGVEYLIVNSRVIRRDMMQIYTQSIPHAISERIKPVAQTATDDEVKWESTKRVPLKDSKVKATQAKSSPTSKKWVPPDKRKSKSVKAWQGGSCTPK